MTTRAPAVLKRLTAAPVRIKPVPRSLLSIHSAIVDLQFVFLHLGICVRMCLHFFSDQINLNPLFSLFAPFRWTKIMWEVFCSYKHLDFLLHSDCILTTFCLHSDYILTTFWLHSDYILTTFWLYSGFILTIFWLHFHYILTTFWLHFDFILTTFWLYST